ncbi:hypothetical protein [Lysobacter capsici]|uniref:hypothetical protein n=1 Tax=Lysobacter capsici TaxID=435897 RepID=UPI001C007816|nr:hypothetical protein [Lysobacter capsici]QWF19555.1 hypothetical protein KME82_12815 [Lysobacter capsici]
MESRKERPAAPGPSRRIAPIVLVAGAAAVFFASAYLLLRGDEGAFDPSPKPAIVDKTPTAPAVAAPVAPTRAAPAPAATTPAKIVLDDDPADANPFSAGDPSPAHQPGPKPAPATPAPKLVASAAPPKAAGKPAIASARTGTAASKRGGSAKSDEDGLMAALLGNIDADAQSGGKRTAKPRNGNAKEDQDALEQLIRKVNAENAVVAKKAAAKPVTKPAPAPKANATPAKSAATKTAATPPANPVQTSLRKCPKANTTKGLQCRQKVCAKYAGQDPACPV